MSAGFRGASASQDSRFSNKEKKLLKTMAFPEELSSPVDISKVNMESMQPWIVKRTTEILKIEDEVVVGLLVNLLEENVNPKMIQIQLTPFLEGNTGAFMTELWKLLLSAQETPSGVPQAFIEEAAKERAKQKALEQQYVVSFNRGPRVRAGGGRSRWDNEDRGGGRSESHYSGNDDDKSNRGGGDRDRGSSHPHRRHHRGRHQRDRSPHGGGRRRKTLDLGGGKGKESSDLEASSGERQRNDDRRDRSRGGGREMFWRRERRDRGDRGERRDRNWGRSKGRDSGDARAEANDGADGGKREQGNNPPPRQPSPRRDTS